MEIDLVIERLAEEIELCRRCGESWDSSGFVRSRIREVLRNSDVKSWELAEMLGIGREEMVLFEPKIGPKLTITGRRVNRKKGRERVLFVPVRVKG
jgi:hypothetical protein